MVVSLMWCGSAGSHWIRQRIETAEERAVAGVLFDSSVR